MGFFKLPATWSRWREAIRAKPYKVIGAPVFKLQFLGEPAGDVDILKAELTAILRREGNTRTAYLSRIQYPSESTIRIALLIDGTAPSKKMAKVIATECAQVVPIDIIFFDDLFAPQKERIRSTLTPFYTHETQ